MAILFTSCSSKNRSSLGAGVVFTHPLHGKTHLFFPQRLALLVSHGDYENNLLSCSSHQLKHRLWSAAHHLHHAQNVKCSCQHLGEQTLKPICQLTTEHHFTWPLQQWVLWSWCRNLLAWTDLPYGIWQGTNAQLLVLDTSSQVRHPKKTPKDNKQNNLARLNFKDNLLLI